MKIKKINLLNFRNYSNSSISFHDKLTILVGNNAQGKTNIVEGISILALTKSFRVGNNLNLIKYGKSKCRIKGIIKKESIITKLEVDLSETEKKLMVNQSNISKVSDYISNLNVILFTPDDLEIIKGSPNIRRNLLNMELSQISKKYLKIYNEYHRLLKTRNEYLKVLFQNSIADKAYLDIITDKLIEKAIFIYKLRKEYIDNINKNIDNYYKNIFGDSGLVIKYTPNIEFDSFEDEVMRKKMKHTFKKNYLKELNYGMTIYGPHRDDFTFIFKERDLKISGSQGQQRLAIICFKLSEITIFKDHSNYYPVLLLDDIFSELDIKKRNKLLKMITEHDVQCIITTTDLKNISKSYIEKSLVYYVKDGTVERK